MYTGSALIWGALASVSMGADAKLPVTFHPGDSRLEIRVGGAGFATYRWNDSIVRRPYLDGVFAPGGVPFTRNNPPVEGVDAVDHATMHPGIWLAFGDLDGADFWRNRADIVHVEFVEPPKNGDGFGSFAARHRYEHDGQVLCEEICRIAIAARPDRHLVDWTSTFRSDRDRVFGDQEEMGLGIRVATNLTVLKGGTIVNSQGLLNEKQVWGKNADWCLYRGTNQGERVGVLMMPSPSNFRPCWFHSRDYGLLVANPFGQNAFTGGPKSAIRVKAGDPFTLRFGLLFFRGDVEPANEYQTWTSEAKPLR